MILSLLQLKASPEDKKGEKGKVKMNSKNRKV